MKVKLIVVQGKPEGKEIPLLGPVFRIGRGETCHLRPTSELVSREHAEFTVTAETVSVRDLGSRNGTLVNGKALTEACVLKDRDLVQVGALTFAVAITDAPEASKTPSSDAPKAAATAVSPDDVSHDDIESWLVSDSSTPATGRAPGVYGGDTITIKAFKGAASPKPEIPTADDASVGETVDAEEYDRLPEGEGDPDQETQEADTQDEVEVEDEASEEIPEDFIDESNPFHVKKSKAPEAPAKPAYKDTSDAASDILRKMMERRRGSK